MGESNLLLRPVHIYHAGDISDTETTYLLVERRGTVGMAAWIDAKAGLTRYVLGDPTVFLDSGTPRV